MFHKQITKLVTLLLVLSVIFLKGFSQNYTHPFDFKKKRFNLGFQMGLNYNAYNLKEQIKVVEGGIYLDEILVRPKMGLSLGMITNYSIHDQISLRFVPGISLEQRDFDYFFGNERDSLVVRKIEASYFNLPFMFQFKTKYYERTRLYVLAGAQIGINLNPSKKVRDDPNLLKIKTEDFALVFGAGFNLYGDRIKLSPEIRYTMGMINIYEPEFTSHANAISLLFTQVLTFSVNFE